jgi:hypothetical protein
MKHYIVTTTVLLGIFTRVQENKAFQDINMVVKETQRVISIARGQKIDTAYFRTLFLPTATFTVVGQDQGVHSHETMDLREFLETLTDDYYSNGYHEEATGEIIEEYNGIAQVFQSFKGVDSENVVGKGVGSYQLIYSGGRWWIANMIWAMSSSNGQGIPQKYINH